jgi:hypothetical protein
LGRPFGAFKTAEEAMRADIAELADDYDDPQAAL